MRKSLAVLVLVLTGLVGVGIFLTRSRPSPTQDPGNADEQLADAPVQSGDREPSLNGVAVEDATNPSIRPAMVAQLAPQFVSIVAGEEITIPLTDGEQVTGIVNLVLKEDDGVVRVGGNLLGNRTGTFSLHWVRGELNGRILIPSEEQAYVISTSLATVGADGVVNLPLGAVICFPMPLASAATPIFSSDTIQAEPQAAPPLLSSRPSADDVVYLHFVSQEDVDEGFSVTDPDWNGGLAITPAKSNLDNSQIEQVWNRVKEDFWPFDLDITTDPARYDAAAPGHRMRVIITPTDTAGPGSGGVAWLESFVASGMFFSDTVPAWVFTTTTNSVAEAISHEVGHTFGLSHDGLMNGTPDPGDDTGYFEGQGAGPTSWAPIMGSGYTRMVVQWAKGEYPDANNTEDDVAIISGVDPTPLNGFSNPFGYIADEAGNDRLSAVDVYGLVDGSNEFEGIIASDSDLDFYAFSAAEGAAVTITATPAALSPNLDITLRLYDGDGNLITEAAPTAALGAEINEVLGAGSYTFSVLGSGDRDVNVDGYSNYGSIGYYKIALAGVGSSGPPVIATPPSSLALLVGDDLNLSVEAHGSLPLAYQWYRNGRAISGATDASLAVSGISLVDAGFYSVAVQNTEGIAPAAGPLIMASGFEHTLYVRNDGMLRGTGTNSVGQLANDSTTSETSPVDAVAGVSQVAAGDTHTLVLKSDGTVWTVGNNNDGQLGDGTTGTRNTLMQTYSDVRQVAAGDFHSLFLKTDGTLWATGLNNHGQVGDGTTTSRSTPVQIASDVLTMAGGWSHTLFVKTDGTLWATGANDHGQLGDGTTTERIDPVQVATDVAEVAAGFAHSLFVKTDGTLWSMGYNVFGQLGATGTTEQHSPVLVTDGVVGVAAGNLHTIYVKDDGTLWGVGSGQYGQLGSGGGGTVHFQIDTGVVAAAAGQQSSFYLKADGTFWALGRNQAGQLGNGTLVDQTTPVQIADDLPKSAVVTVTKVPTITVPPDSVAVAEGDGVTFSVTVVGPGPFTYQWYKDGVAIPGATSSSYTISNPTPADAGAYTLVATNAYGDATSSAANLTVNYARMIALSTRALAGQDENTLIPGILVGGSGAKSMVLRAQVSILESLSVPNLISDPRLSLLDFPAANLVAENDDWGGDPDLVTAFASVGLAALDDPGSVDAAVLADLGPGLYTALVSGATPTLGVTNLEVYDAAPNDYSSSLKALAVRSFSGSGSDVMIVGIVIDGNSPARMVLRGIGPSLGASVPGRALDTELLLYDFPGGNLIASNDNWGGDPDLAAAFAEVGLTVLDPASLDAAIVADLNPGIYTVHVRGVSDTTGIVLMEVYQRP